MSSAASSSSASSSTSASSTSPSTVIVWYHSFDLRVHDHYPLSHAHGFTAAYFDRHPSARPTRSAGDVKGPGGRAADNKLPAPSSYAHVLPVHIFDQRCLTRLTMANILDGPTVTARALKERGIAPTRPLNDDATDITDERIKHPQYEETNASPIAAAAAAAASSSSSATSAASPSATPKHGVASFLLHDIKLDWRYGAAWFESQLIDHDVPSNYGNWTYQAGVAFDPRSPYRYFNLPKQAQMYDPQGTHVKLWLPELKSEDQQAKAQVRTLKSTHTQRINTIVMLNG